MNDVSTLIADVQRARRDYLARVGDLSSEQGEFKPTDEDWSIAGITEHLVRAEQAGISLIWSAADGLRRGQPVWSGDPPHRGRTIEDVIARTWQPREVAPEPARPQWGGPLAFWMAALESCAPMVEALAPELEGLDLERVIHPHPISGPLDAGQRLQFLRFHLDRHRAQVDRVRASRGFPQRPPDGGARFVHCASTA